MDATRIFWEESRLAMKRMTRAQRRIDTKLLSDQCGLTKTLFHRKRQDTHNCPVCSAPMEDRDYLYTCLDIEATKVFEKGNELQRTLEERGNRRQSLASWVTLGVASTPILISLAAVTFEMDLLSPGILRDQADIGWLIFLSGCWSVKWREAQKCYYLRMNKKKSARLWAIAILKKLMMIRWDLWQFRKQVLHSPTGPTAIASHYSLNYQGLPDNKWTLLPVPTR